VAVDATGLGSGQGGDETMMAGLLEGLAEAARPGDSFPLIVRDGVTLPAPVADHPAFSVHSMRRLPGALHFTARLPRALSRLRPVPDLVCAVTHGPLRSPAPVALFVQDLSFHHHPEHYPVVARWRLRTVVPRQARRARAVLTVSEFSRSDLIASYELPPEQVVVVPDAVAVPPPWDDTAAAEGRQWLASQGVDGRFILCLGNLHPRKNVARLVAGFAQARAGAPDLADVRLVVAGARWWGAGEAAAAAQAPDGSVVFLGRFDDDRREQLLRLADALAYVSVFEGFGLPPLEAMARGTVVLASDATAVAETAGDGALLVDPYDVHAIAEGLVRVLSDEQLRVELRRRGAARAAGYDVGSTGRRAREAFAAAIGLTAAPRPGAVS